MSPKKIYVCWRKIDGPVPPGTLEFWTTNKKLFDTYCDIYKEVLTDDKFEFQTRPISDLAVVKFEHKQSELEIIEPPNDYQFTNPIIATGSDLEILDPASIIYEWLALADVRGDILDRLPYQLRVPLMMTKYWALIHGDGENLRWKEDMFETIDVNYDKLHYIAQHVYYTGQSLIDWIRRPEDIPTWQVPL